MCAIDIMYRDTNAKVISPDGETNMFQISSGVLQGDTLAPFFVHNRFGSCSTESNFRLSISDLP